MRTITVLNKNDREALAQTAYILTSLAGKREHWTPEELLLLSEKQDLPNFCTDGALLYEDEEGLSEPIEEEDTTDTRKMYEVAIERKTEDGEDDFTQWLATYLTGPVEVPNTDETIGRFTRENMGKYDNLVHALFIEDEEGWVSEYYVFVTPDTLKHVHINDMED